MKGVINWLFGDELGTTVIKAHEWLWESPQSRTVSTGKTSDEIALEHASQLLELKRSKVTSLHYVVEEVRQSTLKNQHQCKLKSQRRQELIPLTLEYQRMGHTIEARLAMAKVIEIERILPHLQVKLANSEEILMKVNEIYLQQESELSLLEIDVENLKAYIAVNGHQDKSFPDLISLQEKIHNSSIEAENRCRELYINGQLNYPSNCELGESLSDRDIDERIRELADLE